MAPDNLDVESIATISPEKIAMYLKYKRWQKEKEVEGVASIWSYITTDKRVSVLLPLDKSFADFEIKIEELIAVLVKIERRPETEILKALQSTSIIARQKNREIIDLKLQFSETDKHEVLVREIGTVLKSLQDFFSSIGNLKSKTIREKKQKANIKAELQLSLLDTFHGSFGIRIGLAKLKYKYKQLELFDDVPITEGTAEDFMNLMKASGSNNPEKLRREIEKFRGEPSIKFKTLIKSLMELESDLVLEWGSVNPEKGAIAELPLHKIVEAFEIIRKVELEVPFTYEVVGRLIVGGVGEKKDKRIFFLIDEKNNKEYKGHISPGLISSLNNYIELDQIYRATIEETSGLNPTTGEEIIIYKLIRLDKI